MATKEIRLQARKQARELLAQTRKDRLDLERRRDALAVTVLTSLAERDALVADAEKRAGTALTQLVHSGLSITDATGWCGNLTDKEANRLMKLATIPTPQDGGATERGAIEGGAKKDGPTASAATEGKATDGCAPAGDRDDPSSGLT